MSISDGSMQHSIISNDDFYLLCDESGKVRVNGSVCNLMLSREHVVYQKKNSQVLEYVEMSTIIGAQTSVPKRAKDSTFTLTLFRYVPSKGGCCSSRVRAEKHMAITFENQDNDKNCQNWTNAINGLCLPLGQALISPTSKSEFISPPRRKFLVFVNPAGGKGLAMSMWKTTTQPMLQQANIEVTLVVTERALHARDYVNSSKELTSYFAILVISGDGLVFEIINGIANRPDGQDIFHSSLCIMHIPGGSSNGLCKSILFESQEEYSPCNATYVAVKGSKAPMDLCRVQTATGQTYYSNLILGWGLISDIDILSETMRWMGEPRFYLAAVYFMLKKKRYRGKLSILRKNKHIDFEKEDSYCSKHGKRDGLQKKTSWGTLPPISPLQELEEPLLEGVSSPTPKMSKGDKWESRWTRMAVENDGERGGERDKEGSSWLTIEDEFIMVWKVQSSHCSASMYSGPGVSLNNGALTFYVVRANISRFQMIQILLDVDAGDFVKHPAVEVYHNVDAYRLEPVTKGIFSLDGELIEYGPIQGTVLPSAVQVLKV